MGKEHAATLDYLPNLRYSLRNGQGAARSGDANALEVRPSRPRLRYLVRTSTYWGKVLVWPLALFRDAELVRIALDWRVCAHAHLRRFCARQAIFSSLPSAILHTTQHRE